MNRIHSALIAVALVAGCAGGPAEVEATQFGLQGDLPGCSDAPPASGKLGATDLPHSWGAGLATLTADGVAYCVDSNDVVRGLIGTWSLGSSNPMPGTDPGSSNPMPGTASNPTDPNSNTSSNPMPGSSH